MSDRHLVVVSVDALVYEDLAFAATLPAFGKLLKNPTSTGLPLSKSKKSCFS